MNYKNTKSLSNFERVDLQYFTDLCTIISAKRVANLHKIIYIDNKNSLRIIYI